jgi:hypothetical protein
VGLLLQVRSEFAVTHDQEPDIRSRSVKVGCRLQEGAVVLDRYETGDDADKRDLRRDPQLSDSPLRRSDRKKPSSSRPRGITPTVSGLPIRKRSSSSRNPSLTVKIFVQAMARRRSIARKRRVTLRLK